MTTLDYHTGGRVRGAARRGNGGGRLDIAPPVIYFSTEITGLMNNYPI